MKRMTLEMCQLKQIDIDMKGIKTTAWVMLISIGLMSCGKKTNQPSNQPSQHAGKLAKVDFGNGTYDSIFYRQDGKIDKINIVYELGGNTYREKYQYFYNTAGQIDILKEEDGDEYRYAYNNGQLVAVNHFVNGVKMDYKLYNYVGAGTRIESIEEYHKPYPTYPGFEFTFQKNYNYYAEGNLKEEVGYQINTLGQSTKYITVSYVNYDQKINIDYIYRSFLYMSGVKLTANNVTKLVRTDEVSGVSNTYNYQFTYNSKGEPTKRQLINPPGGSVETVVTYSYY